MVFPRNSLRAFLQHAKRNLNDYNNGSQRVNIVVGNESADLDSLTSCLIFAYIRSMVGSERGSSPVYIPLVNIPASGLRLRPEFAAVCNHANISPSHLITLQDLPGPLTQPENVHWILVDHNKLQGELGEKYASQIFGVIDHHDEEYAVRKDTYPEPRIIEKCGSCTSLVIRYCKPMWDQLSLHSLSSGAAHSQGEAAIDDAIVVRGWDAQVAKLALASILIDTANLKAPGKVAEVDREAVEYLESKIELSPKNARLWNRDAYYKEIDEAKRDIEGLSLDEILRKDYKQWTEKGVNLGISSVVKPLDFLVSKAQDQSAPGADKPPGHYTWLDRLQQFINERDLSVFGIMTAFTSADGEFQRQLFLQGTRSQESVLNQFKDRAISEFNLEDLEVDDIPLKEDSKSDWLRPSIWTQKDLSKSRKQVAPLLREVLKENRIESTNGDLRPSA